MPAEPFATSEHDRPQSTQTVNIDGREWAGLPAGPYRWVTTVSAVSLIMILLVATMWWIASFIKDDRVESAALFREHRQEAREERQAFQKMVESQQVSLNANNHNLAGMTNMVNALTDAVKKLNADVDALRTDVKSLNKVAGRIPGDVGRADPPE